MEQYSLTTLWVRSNLRSLNLSERALWRSGLSARVPECQKLKMVGYAFMALNICNVTV